MENVVDIINSQKPIVKYDRLFCEFVGFNGLSKFDQDFFYAVLTILKEEEKMSVSIPIYELVERAGYKDKIKQQHRLTFTGLCKELVGMASRVMKCSVIFNYDESTEILALFDSFKVDTNAETLTVTLGASFSNVFFGIDGNKFTRFYLERFLSLKSKYSKALYRLLLDHYTDFTISIDDLYYTLQLKSKNSQNQFIYRLQKYIDEVQATGDFSDNPPIQFELHRNRRKITSITFMYREKSNRMQMLRTFDNKENDLPCCPYCNQKLRWAKNSITGEVFIGHVEWQTCKCKCKTYDSLAMLREHINEVKMAADKQKEKAIARDLEEEELAAMQKKADNDPNWSPFPLGLPDKENAAKLLPSIQDITKKQ